MPTISIVAAIATNEVIGRDGDMPWRLPSDLKRFKALTFGKPVIMGRKTYASIGKPLAGRDTIVVSRQPAPNLQGDRVFHALSFDDALNLARTRAEILGSDDIIVAGGSGLFAEALAFADRLHLTLVDATPDGDTTFPDVDWSLWTESDRRNPQRQPSDSAGLTFISYRRIRANAAGFGKNNPEA